MPVQKCQVNGTSGYKWGEHGKCYTGSDAKEKAEAQGRAAHAAGWEGAMILQLETAPAIAMGDSMTTYGREHGLKLFKKELVKVGRWTKASTGQFVDVTREKIDNWIETFSKWRCNGNRVPIPPGHSRANDPKENQGWVTNMFRQGDTLVAMMELLNPELAKVNDVSIAIEPKMTDGKGNKYKSIISHVALCVDPVVSGLKDFEAMSLSLSKGVKTMEFLKKIAAALGLKGAEPTEEAILLALEDHKAGDATATIKLSGGPTDAALVRLVSNDRAKQLSNLVQTGRITPAIKDKIAKRYVETKAVALELSKGIDDGFELLHDVLSENASSDLLEELSAIQSVELADQRQSQPNALVANMNKLRVSRGLEAVPLS